MTRLIALTGAAGSGKSTAADYLVRTGWKRVKFAGPLKDMMRALYRGAGLPEDQIERRIEGDLKERHDPLLGAMNTPRWAMQTLGTEWGRDLITPGLWTGIAAARIRAHLSDGDRVVVDDCRFDNEAATIHDLGGKVVQITGRGGIAGKHVSEQGVAPDLICQNTGTIAELQGWLEYVLNDNRP
jgi:hypothetical protein